jgi:anti-sigma28 factor (negative regulator of flagellin synthesis)
MASTGTIVGGGARAKPRAAARLAGRDGDIDREMRIEELRQLVASGRYKVEPHKLGLRILVRALKRG